MAGTTSKKDKESDKTGIEKKGAPESTPISSKDLMNASLLLKKAAEEQSNLEEADLDNENKKVHYSEKAYLRFQTIESNLKTFGLVVGGLLEALTAVNEQLKVNEKVQRETLREVKDLKTENGRLKGLLQAQAKNKNGSGVPRTQSLSGNPTQVDVPAGSPAQGQTNLLLPSLTITAPTSPLGLQPGLNPQVLQQQQLLLNQQQALNQGVPTNPTYAGLAANAAHLPQQAPPIAPPHWQYPKSRKQKRHEKAIEYHKTKIKRELIMMGVPEPEGETVQEKNDNEHKNVIATCKKVCAGLTDIDWDKVLWTHTRHHTSQTEPKQITLVFKKEEADKVEKIKAHLKGVHQNTFRPSLTPEERKRKKKAAEKWGKLTVERQQLDRDTAWRCPFM